MSDEIRIGDVEREQAARAIGEHFAQGRLTRDEYDERLDRVWRAKTFGELRPMFGDLPGPRPTFLERPAPGPIPFPFGGPPRPSHPPMPVGSYVPGTPHLSSRGSRGWLPVVLLVLVAMVLVNALDFLGVVIVAVVGWILLSKRARRAKQKGPHSGHFPGYGPSC